MRDNLVPVRYDGSGMPHYETDKDAVYMPRQKNFDHYNDYVQETLRQIVSATGHQQRLAREGMVMKTVCRLPTMPSNRNGWSWK